MKEDETYIVNFKFTGGDITCITKYSGQPISLVSKLLGIDKHHIRPISINNIYANINVLNLQTGKKYVYVTSPWTKEELDTGLNKTKTQIEAEMIRFRELEKQNALVTFNKENRKFTT